MVNVFTALRDTLEKTVLDNAATAVVDFVTRPLEPANLVAMMDFTENPVKSRVLKIVWFVTKLMASV